MSYKTTTSQIFMEAPKPSPRQRRTQDYTAITVDDPRTDQFQEPTPPREQTVVRVVEKDSNPKLDELMTRQKDLMSHQYQVSSRQDELTAHLAKQNNALNQALLQQILNNKDSVIANLADQGADSEERTRALLTQHIRYIVAIVQRLNMDIESLEAELRGRDIAVMGTNKAVNKLEVHHVTMLQDMRGRIARCDNAINKHSKDIVLLMDEIKRLEGALYGTRERMLADFHRLEAEVISMTGELERQTGVQRGDIGNLRKDLMNRINQVEDKQQLLLVEFKNALGGNQTNVDHRLDRMEAKFKAMIDKATSGWGNLMDQIDGRIEQNLMAILSRLAKLEDHMASDRGNLQNLQRNIENQVIATIQDSLAYNDAELQRAKIEFRNGFTELQDSLSNLKAVVEGRRKILANQVQRDIGQVKKALYMEMPTQQPQGTTVVFRNFQKNKDQW